MTAQELIDQLQIVVDLHGGDVELVTPFSSGTVALRYWPKYKKLLIEA